MKRPTMLLNRVLLNEGLQVSLPVERDIQEIECRFEHEGMSFLTITLPSLCDALDQGLAKGRIAPTMFKGFKPFRRGGKLPAMLAGFFMRVFDAEGWLLDQPCIDSIRAIRQVTRLFKKVELPCSPARVKQAFERYKSNDQEHLRRSGGLHPDDSLFRLVCSHLWSDLEVLSGELYCSPGSFGTGATAERAFYNARHSVIQWPERGNSTFPLDYHTSHRIDDVESFQGIEIIDEHSERPVRVVGVAKTLKTPRIISVEPSYMMLRQQSVAKPLMNWLESGRLGIRSIRFTDQTVNRDLARVGSIDGVLATIDLKDASDLVSLELVQTVFQSCPSFLDYLLDSRSRKAQLPSGEVLSLRKFASQGSAMCFPIEAMVFLSLTCTALVKQSGKQLSRRLVLDLCKKIAVYGDDIIVPSETASGVMEILEAYGLKVNHDKSFHTGLFRESCGGDYFKGHDVTPTYVRQWAPDGRLHGSALAAYVSLSNHLYEKGLWHACQYVRDHIDRRLRAKRKMHRIFRNRRELGVLTYKSYVFDTGCRWDSDLQRYRVSGPQLVPATRADPVKDLRGAMLLAFGPKSIRQEWNHRRRNVEEDYRSGRLSTADPQSIYTYLDGLSDPRRGSESYSVDGEIGTARWVTTLSLDVTASAIDGDVSVRPRVLETKRGWAFT